MARERKDPYAKLLKIAQRQRESELRNKELEPEIEEPTPSDIEQQLQEADKKIEEQAVLVSRLLERGTSLDAEFLEMDHLLSNESDGKRKIPLYIWITGALIVGLFLGWSGMIQLGI